MAIVRAVVEFHHTSNMPEDNYINTFHFNTPGTPSQADHGLIHAALAAFYDLDHGLGTASIAAFLGNQVSRTVPPLIKQYIVTPGLAGPDDDTIGSPVYTDDFTLDAPLNATQAPHQIALVMSFRGDYGSLPEVQSLPPSGPEGDNRLRSRVRGRVYLGPFNDAALNGQFGVPNPDLVDQAREGGAYLRDHTTLAAAGIDWAVYSRVNAAAVPVTTGWVDDSWDVIRRRKREAQNRMLFDAAV